VIDVVWDASFKLQRWVLFEPPFEGWFVPLSAKCHALFACAVAIAHPPLVDIASRTDRARK
jgi:hypothetical protein